MGSIVDDSALEPYRLVARPADLSREGLFVVEGRLVLPRLLASRYRVHSVLVSDAAHDALAPLLAAHPDVRVLVKPAGAINEIAGYDFHRGCLALGYREMAATRRLLEPGAWSLGPMVILERVSNPDNIGGIFRSAHAFGAGAVLLGPGCGDPLYRKAIRTSMGATLDVPWAALDRWPDDLAAVRERVGALIALTTDPSAPPLRDVVRDSARPIAFLLGSEGFGLSGEALSFAQPARIPMSNPNADSLNVAAAASIALYEAGLD